LGKIATQFDAAAQVVAKTQIGLYLPEGHKRVAVAFARDDGIRRTDLLAGIGVCHLAMQAVTALLCNFDLCKAVQAEHAVRSEIDCMCGQRRKQGKACKTCFQALRQLGVDRF